MRRVAPALQYAGILGAVFGLSKLHALAHQYDFTGSSRFSWAIAYAVLLGLATYGAGLPDLARGRNTIVTAATATGSAAAVFSLCQLVIGSALLPRFTVFGAAAVLVPWSALVSHVDRDTETRAGERDRIVFVGTQSDSATLLDDLALRPEHPAAMVASIEPHAARPARAGEEPLVDTVIDCDATVLVLAREAQDDALVVAQASTLHEAGVRVRSLTAFYDEWLGKLPISELERLSLMFDIAEVHETRYGRGKRLIDMVIGAAGVVALVLVAPFVLVGNRVANRGPLFYRQTRVGRHGRAFPITKFRTMRPHDGTVPDEWTTENDPRITRFGRLLRRTHLDELPQAWNIVRGDLAVVGPRPEQPHYVSELSSKLPYYGLRHLVRPGLTGWAQVKYGYAGSERDALEKLQYEFYYLGHQSLRFDARVLARTLRSVLGSEGR
ncbi:MAG TPA: sugar transferase [Acidimicrobiia bacterium]|nr:sugar transferase [Acidimicrobiia bacterium]